MLTAVATITALAAVATLHAALRTLIGGQAAILVGIELVETLGQTRVLGGFGAVDGAIVVGIQLHLGGGSGGRGGLGGGHGKTRNGEAGGGNGEGKARGGHRLNSGLC